MVSSSLRSRKLASSMHTSTPKEGPCNVENYGAYGWGTGVRSVKWITDHFLVRGINYYVPHAFHPRITQIAVHLTSTLMDIIHSIAISKAYVLSQ